jgi:hypothetical protein
VIRHVALLWFKPGTDPARIEAVRQRTLALRTPGIRSICFAEDAGLREGNAECAVVVDVDDEAAYAAYDTDPEHLRVRTELLLPILSRVERCQVRLDEGRCYPGQGIHEYEFRPDGGSAPRRPPPTPPGGEVAGKA